MTDTISRFEWSAAANQRYLCEHVVPLKPVVLTGAIEGWPALAKWTPDFFKAQYPGLALTIDGRSWRMAEFVERVLKSSAQDPAPYLNQHPVEEWPAELIADVFPLPPCTRPNWVESKWFPSRFSYRAVQAFIGGTGAKFPFLHYDHWHLSTWLMQLYGEKEYVAFAPDQARFLYPIGGGKENISQVDSIDAPDLDRFPLIAQAVGYRFALRRGETLFMPAGWWHSARILSPSITVSTSGANAGNWAAFAHDLLRDQRQKNWLKAAALSLYFPIFAAAMGRRESA